MRLVGTLLTAVVLLLALDAAVTVLAEREAAAQVGQVLGGQASVDLRGWPVTYHLVRGVVPAVDITASAAPLGPVRLERLEATLTGVRQGLDAIWEPPDGLPPFDGGRFTADLSPGAIARLLPPLPGLPVASVELSDGEVVLDFGGQLRFSTPVQVADGSLVLRTGSSLLGEVRVPLPALPAGAVVTSAAVTTGVDGPVLRLAGDLHGSP